MVSLSSKKSASSEMKMAAATPDSAIVLIWSIRFPVSTHTTMVVVRLTNASFELHADKASCLLSKHFLGT
jgi:hypothetical protein